MKICCNCKSLLHTKYPTTFGKNAFICTKCDAITNFDGKKAIWSFSRKTVNFIEGVALKNKIKKYEQI
tara:strand:- start:186 stop:389 length:204 start_codon:yes stop_codon:yes gene_type:complete